MLMGTYYSRFTTPQPLFRIIFGLLRIAVLFRELRRCQDGVIWTLNYTWSVSMVLLGFTKDIVI